MTKAKSTRTPANFKDLTGQRFGRLTVIERAENGGGRGARWRCACDCGGEAVAQGQVLRKGQSQSCGCLRREVTSTRRLMGLTGQRFGRLTVIERAENTGAGSTRWHCACDCGGEATSLGTNLRRGRVKSCGCLSREAATTHGLTCHPLYMTWRGMKQRCTNPDADNWKHYGARGIGVYPEWLANPAAFFAYVGERPEGCSLDRIDNDGNYEPDNVRWATASEQENNKRPKG